jgi:hypothetical protein
MCTNYTVVANNRSTASKQKVSYAHASAKRKDNYGMHAAAAATTTAATSAAAGAATSYNDLLLSKSPLRQTSAICAHHAAMTETVH